MSAERLTDERLAELAYVVQVWSGSPEPRPGGDYQHIAWSLAQSLTEAIAEIVRLRQIEEAARRVDRCFPVLKPTSNESVEAVALTQLRAVLARAALPEAPQDQTDEQHPSYVDPIQGLIWQAHCNACGVYVDDWVHGHKGEPPTDYLCSECMEAT